jgi:hypothetical protein
MPSQALRFSGILLWSGSWTSSSLVLPSQLLRFMVSPNLLFGVAYFFLALDPHRYGVYRPLIVAGKATVVLTGLFAAPSVLNVAGSSIQPGLAVFVSLLIVVVWDVLSAQILLFRRLPAANTDDNQATPAQAEVVEVE